MNIQNHSYSHKIPLAPRPPWVDQLKVPRGKNRGIFTPTYTLEIVQSILFGADAANSLNRPLKTPELRPIIMAIRDGTFAEDWIDPIAFDWNWKLISGQKRLYSIYHAWLSRHQSYKHGIRMRTEYGISPEHRPLSDAGEEREFRDKKHFVEGNPKVNKLIHAALVFGHKQQFRLYANSLSITDLEDMLKTNVDGFLWACRLPAAGSFSMAPIRFALAEGYKINSTKTTSFANELLDIPVKDKPRVEQACLYRRFVSASGRRRGDQTEPYQKLVYALQSHFMDSQIGRLRSATWTPEQMAVLAYPRKEPIDLRAKEPDSELGQATIPDYYIVAGAVRLVCRNPIADSNYIIEQIKERHDLWLLALKNSRRMYRTVGSYSRSALIAFCYLHQSENGFDALLENKNTVSLIKAASLRIKTEHGSFSSRAAREACLCALLHATNRPLTK